MTQLRAPNHRRNDIRNIAIIAHVDHVPGQEIPLGLLVTMPMPLPPTVTVSRLVEAATLNRAATVALSFTKQAAVPEQAPLHPANTEPASAAAFNDTVVPS